MGLQIHHGPVIFYSNSYNINDLNIEEKGGCLLCKRHQNTLLTMMFFVDIILGLLNKENS